MNESRIWFEPDLFAWLELVTFAEHRDYFLASKLSEYLRFRTGWLDDNDLGFGAVGGNGEMFGPDTVDGGSTV